jgi:hypothetical protein
MMMRAHVLVIDVSDPDADFEWRIKRTPTVPQQPPAPATGTSGALKTPKLLKKYFRKSLFDV